MYLKQGKINFELGNFCSYGHYDTAMKHGEKVLAGRIEQRPRSSKEFSGVGRGLLCDILCMRAA